MERQNISPFRGRRGGSNSSEVEEDELTGTLESERRGQDILDAPTGNDSREDEEDSGDLNWTAHSCGAPVHRSRCQSCKDYLYHLSPDDESLKDFALKRRFLESDRAARLLVAKTDKLHGTIRGLEDKYRRERELSRRYKSERNSLREDLDETKDKLDIALEDNDKLKDEIEDLEAERTTSKETYQQLQELIKQATSNPVITTANEDTSNAAANIKPLGDRLQTPESAVIEDASTEARPNARIRHEEGKLVMHPRKGGMDADAMVTSEDERERTTGRTYDAGVVHHTSENNSVPRRLDTDQWVEEVDKQARNAKSRARRKAKRAEIRGTPERDGEEVPNQVILGSTSLVDRISGPLPEYDARHHDNRVTEPDSLAFAPGTFNVVDPNFTVPPQGATISDQFRWFARDPSPRRTMPGPNGTWQSWHDLPGSRAPIGSNDRMDFRGSMRRTSNFDNDRTGPSRGRGSSFEGGRAYQESNYNQSRGHWRTDRGRGKGTGNRKGGSYRKDWESNDRDPDGERFNQIRRFQEYGITTESEVDQLVKATISSNPTVSKESTLALQKLVEDAVAANPRPPLAQYLLKKNKEVKGQQSRKTDETTTPWSFDADRPFAHPPFSAAHTENWVTYFTAFPSETNPSVIPGIRQQPPASAKEVGALRGALTIAEMAPERADVTKILRVVVNSINRATIGGKTISITTGISKSGRRERFQPPSFEETGITVDEAFLTSLGRTRFSESEAKDIHDWAQLNIPEVDPNGTVKPTDIYEYVNLDKNGADGDVALAY